MANSLSRWISGVDGDAGVADYVARHKRAVTALAFAAVVVLVSIASELAGSGRIAAIVLAWGLFMALIVVLFGLLPYWAIGFLGYRER